MSMNVVLAGEPQHATRWPAVQVFSTCPSSSATPINYLNKVIDVN